MFTKIYFDPKNAETVELLRLIGFEEDRIARGFVTGSDCQASKVDVSSLRALATCVLQEDSFEISCTLGSEEARKGLELIRSHGAEKIQGLFRNRCIESPDILNNLLGINRNARFFGEVLPASCSYSYRFPPVQVLGVYYPDNLVPDFVAKAAKAVVQVTVLPDGSGSAVFISPEGDLLTARHVLYDENAGRLIKGVAIRMEGREIPIRAEHVIYADKRLDLVRLRIPLLKGMPYLEIAGRPRRGEEVWSIGFPGQAFLGGKEPQRLSTLGTVIDVGNNNPHRLATNARAAAGNSGGALINGRGGLVAIMTSVWMASALNRALQQPDYSKASIPPPEMLTPVSP